MSNILKNLKDLEKNKKGDSLFLLLKIVMVFLVNMAWKSHIFYLVALMLLADFHMQIELW